MPKIKIIELLIAFKSIIWISKNNEERDIKNNKEFVSKREEILSMIWDMEEEIMGKEV